MSTKKGVCVPEPAAVRSFGKRLKNFSYSQHNLPFFADSWTAGGCAVFAKALKAWVGPHGTLHTLVRHAPKDPEKGTPDHVVVKIGPYYLDADGAHTKKSLIHNSIHWYASDPPNFLALAPDNFELRPTKPSDTNGNSIACPIYGVRSLAEHIIKTFGTNPKSHICPNR